MFEIQIKNNSQDGSCMFWYQVLRDYRINYPEELLKWKYKIEHILDDDFYNLAYK